MCAKLCAICEVVLNNDTLVTVREQSFSLCHYFCVKQLFDYCFVKGKLSKIHSLVCFLKGFAQKLLCFVPLLVTNWLPLVS